MKPDFEKMAAVWFPDAYMTRKLLVEDIREAYAAGYRDGQARMQERCFANNSLESIDKMELEEPPT